MSTKRHEQPPTAPAVSAPAAAPPIPSPTAPPAVSVPTEAARDAPRGGAAANNGRKRKNLGRNEYNRTKDEDHTKKRTRPIDTWGPRPNAPEGEDKEERRPKRKVAVMISYCGTGYKGMQLNPPHKSIEGDLFEAFVAAGAISQANSNDPKKSSLVRCARTDKGVHAAGNVISLKLIVEDPDVVAKINAALPAQIRVWDIIRTTGSFSSYQLCDSRKYEYLVPSHVFLPPHPNSYLAKTCLEYAEREGDLEEHLARQKEVADWWPTVNEKVDKILGEDRAAIEKAIEEDNSEDPWQDQIAESARKAVDPLLRKIRDIHTAEKRAYRISPERLERVRDAFGQYVGTHNFYNYTINKTFKDPSAKRHIKTFDVTDPVIINGTEWLSLHVHGQSFMMHQIRKMVGLVMMVVRTGCPVSRIQEAFTPCKISIGKAPSLGLLLEYPLFSHYNEKISKENGRDPLDFEKYKDEINKFKQDFIYGKIYDEEEKQNIFAQFVQYLDSYKSPTYLYLTSAGFKALDEAAAKSGGKLPIPREAPGNESDDEAGGDEEG